MMRPFIGLLSLVLLCCLLPMLAAAQTKVAARPYGDASLVNEFIYSEMVYPDAALEEGREGNVTLRFFVGKEGEVSNIQVKEGVSPEVDREAIRILRMLQWEPAIRLGNPVMTEEEFTIKFNIKKYRRQCKQRGYEIHEYPYLPADTTYKVYRPEQLDKLPRPLFDEKGMDIEKFITRNLVYPEAAYKQNISGRVVLSFVVETHGRPSNIITENPVAGGCTEEALRILGMIRWMPGIMDEKAVRSRVKLNITFRLPGDTRTKVYDNNQGAL